MNFFLIMIAPVLIIIVSIVALFFWGSIGKERY